MANKKIEIRQYDNGQYDCLLQPKTSAEQVTYNDTTVENKLSSLDGDISNLSDRVTTEVDNLTQSINTKLTKPATGSGVLTGSSISQNTQTREIVDSNEDITINNDGIPTANAVKEAVLERVPNQGKGINLLHNWYFVGGGYNNESSRFPINSRGSLMYEYTEYSNFTIDNWRTRWLNLTIQQDSIVLQCPNEASHVGRFEQTIDQYSRYGWLVNSVLKEPITISVWIKQFSGTGGQLGFNIGSNIVGTAINRVGLIAYTLNTNNLDNLSAAITVDKGSSIQIAAMKVEYGNESTLLTNVGTSDSPDWRLNDPVPIESLEVLKCKTSTDNGEEGNFNIPYTKENNIEVPVGTHFVTETDILSESSSYRENVLYSGINAYSYGYGVSKNYEGLIELQKAMNSNLMLVSGVNSLTPLLMPKNSSLTAIPATYNYNDEVITVMNFDCQVETGIPYFYLVGNVVSGTNANRTTYIIKYNGNDKSTVWVKSFSNSATISSNHPYAVPYDICVKGNCVAICGACQSSTWTSSPRDGFVVYTSNINSGNWIHALMLHTASGSQTIKTSMRLWDDGVIACAMIDWSTLSSSPYYINEKLFLADTNSSGFKELSISPIVGEYDWHTNCAPQLMRRGNYIGSWVYLWYDVNGHKKNKLFLNIANINTGEWTRSDTEALYNYYSEVVRYGVVSTSDVNNDYFVYWTSSYLEISQISYDIGAHGMEVVSRASITTPQVTSVDTYKYPTVFSEGSVLWDIYTSFNTYIFGRVLGVKYHYDGLHTYSIADMTAGGFGTIKNSYENKLGYQTYLVNDTSGTGNLYGTFCPKLLKSLNSSLSHPFEHEYVKIN